MSLKKTNWEYISIEKVSSNLVEIRVCENEAQRLRFKAWTMSSFETTHWELRVVEVDLNAIPDSTKSIKDNQTTVWYEALKALEEFKDCVDV